MQYASIPVYRRFDSVQLVGIFGYPAVNIIAYLILALCRGCHSVSHLCENAERTVVTPPPEDYDICLQLRLMTLIVI